MKRTYTIQAKNKNQPQIRSLLTSVIQTQPTVSSKILSSNTLLMSLNSETQLCQSSILNTNRTQNNFTQQPNLTVSLNPVAFKQDLGEIKQVSNNSRKYYEMPQKNDLSKIVGNKKNLVVGNQGLLGSSVSQRVIHNKNLNSHKTFSPVQIQFAQKNPVYFNIYNSSLNPSLTNLQSKFYK